METKTQHGYLVFADISGYTSCLAGTELDHAHEILTDLLETIVGRLKGLLTTSNSISSQPLARRAAPASARATTACTAKTWRWWRRSSTGSPSSTARSRVITHSAQGSHLRRRPR
ncbi:MAG TPA: hypothetical protein VI793_04710 [Anaerolineales bacterium]|nr:hypothetical protein [Anaerolineales bacterium]